MTSTLSPAAAPLTTLQLVEAMAARLDAAGVSFGHGTTNAFDEAAWLVLWQLGHPLHALDEVADDAVTPEAAAQVEALVQRRIDSRRPAAFPGFPVISMRNIPCYCNWM
jgi:ribosomal protein L3 glutamine methyltransferase